jgi:hypothetical protein
MRLILLVSSVFSQGSGNEFIDELDFTDVNLNLNNASYIGKKVNFEEHQIEVFRGKIRTNSVLACLTAFENNY